VHAGKHQVGPVERGGGVGGGDGEHGHAGPPGGEHAHRRVLHHDALLLGNRERGGRAPVGFGIGLARGHVVGGDHDLRQRQADGGQPAGVAQRSIDVRRSGHREARSFR
jgi:hypothetical protein